MTSRPLLGLRIAFSAICALTAILLICLWVRSGHQFDSIGPVMSAQGRLYLFPKVNIFPAADGDATIETYNHFHGAITTTVTQNVHVTAAPGTGPMIPFWLLTVTGICVAALPWLPIRRFSLRTLLLATTLIACVLGTVVWFSR